MQVSVRENDVLLIDSEGASKKVGVIDGDSYVSPRSLKSHFFFNHNGWGVDAGLLGFLKEKGIRFVKIAEEMTEQTFTVDVSMFDKFGIEEEFEGHGKQRILPQRFWANTVDDYRDDSRFCHLHVHSDYSILDGMGRVPELVWKAARQQQPALALTDHGYVFGIYELKKYAKEAGIKPILGCEFYLVEDVESTRAAKDRFRMHLVLIAKNQTGYRNLLKLATLAATQGFYYRPRIDFKMLAGRTEGLIATSACMYGEIFQSLLNGEKKETLTRLKRYKELFGEDFYLEIQPTDMDEYREGNERLIKLAEYVNIPMIATCDCHYAEPTDREFHKVLLCINFKKQITDDVGMAGNTYFLQSAASMRLAFSEHHPKLPMDAIDKAIENTVEVAAKVEDYDIDVSLKMPENVEGDLRVLAHNALDDLGARFTENPEYNARLDKELDDIYEMGFEKYFLIMKQTVDFCRKKGILYGPGRGSAAGCLVSYALGITNIDPLEHGLIFERFLNKGRAGSSPDIDMDFDADRREEVMNELAGQYRTAKISTFQTLGGRGIIRDVCRVLNIPYPVADKLAKAITPAKQEEEAIAIIKSIAESEDVAQMARDYPQIFSLARRLEGRIRSKGQHPAGMIVMDSNQKISNHVALHLSSGSTGDPLVQIDVGTVDRLGLTKLDILSSKTITTISRTLDLISERHPGTFIDKLDFLNSIPLDDESCFEQFREGNTKDIFQFQSDGMMETLRKVKPKVFEDLVAVTALFRPGASDFIEEFAEGNYLPEITELHPIVGKTRGVSLYQEQSMEMAVQLAGFTLEEADELRKAIGKKKPELMTQLHDKFVAGCLENNMTKENAETVFEMIRKSQRYAFNKSHAAAYTLVSFWAMWLRTHYTVEYVTAELTSYASDSSNLERVERYIGNAEELGIEILPPDVNVAEGGFKIISDNQVMCGLLLVKKVGEKAPAEIISKRPFDGLDDFSERIDGRKVNRGAVQNLISVGAFDWTRQPRSLMWERVEQQKKKKTQAWPTEVSDWTQLQLAKREMDALGFSLREDPYGFVVEWLEDSKAKPFKDLKGKKGRKVMTGGLITKITPYQSKNGEMAFVDLEDGNGGGSMNVWAESWSGYKKQLQVGHFVIVVGKILEPNKVGIDSECAISIKAKVDA